MEELASLNPHENNPNNNDIGITNNNNNTANGNLHGGSSGFATRKTGSSSGDLYSLEQSVMTDVRLKMCATLMKWSILVSYNMGGSDRFVDMWFLIELLLEYLQNNRSQFVSLFELLLLLLLYCY